MEKIATTQAQRNILEVIAKSSDVARQSFTSKATLKQLAALQDKGLIDYRPFEGLAFLTDLGRSVIAP